MVVFTGGEPLLQLDEPLIAACKHHGLYVAVKQMKPTDSTRARLGVCVTEAKKHHRCEQSL